MEPRRGRRRFLGLLGAGTSGSLLLALGREAGAQAPQAAAPKKDMPPVFQGTSKKGNVQEALDAAIQAALESAPGADRLVNYRVKDVSGRSGGIAGFNDVTVTIEATIS